MKDKSVKAPRPNAKEATRKIGSDSAKEKLIRNAPRPKREGPDNLRQRAEWFRRRTGGARVK